MTVTISPGYICPRYLPVSAGCSLIRLGIGGLLLIVAISPTDRVIGGAPGQSGIGVGEAGMVATLKRVIAKVGVGDSGVNVTMGDSDGIKVVVTVGCGVNEDFDVGDNKIGVDVDLSAKHPESIVSQITTANKYSGRLRTRDLAVLPWDKSLRFAAQRSG